MRAWPLTALLVVSCIGVDGDGPWIYDGPVNSCKDDGDCPGASCRQDIGRCVTPPPAAGSTLWVRVTPAADLGAQAQAFSVVLGPGGVVAQAIEIRRPVAVQGATMAGDAALQAAVVFIDRDNQLPGWAAPRTVYRSRERAFELDLLPGAYDIVVLPEGPQAAAFAPHYIDGVLLGDDGLLSHPDAPEQAVDLILEEPGTIVTGRVIQGGNPVNGLTVRAVDLDGIRTISTSGVTACAGEGIEAECGRFSIGLARGVAEFSLHFSRPEEGHHPAILVDGFAADPETAGAVLDLDGDERLALPVLGAPLRYVARVERPVESVLGQQFIDPAPGCFVRFAGDDIGGGRVERWVTTNESGTIEESEGVVGVNLYPGDYGITVIPAEALGGALTDYALFSTANPVSIVGSGEIAGQVFFLPWRPLYKGSVHAAGKKVPKASLSAEPLAGSTPFPRQNSASTGFNGLYSLWLDPAKYVLTVEAPLESGYSWLIERLEVTGNAEVDLQLPLPWAVEARLVPAQGQDDPVDPGGALVEFFIEIDGVAFLAARAKADAVGDVMALLPPL